MIDELVRLAEVDSSMGSHKDSLVRNIYTKVKEARTDLSKIAGLKPEKVLDTIAGSNEGLMPQFSNNVFYGYGEMNITGKFGEIYTLKYKDGKMVTIRVKISGDSRLLYKVEANGKTTKIDSKEYIELNKLNAEESPSS